MNHTGRFYHINDTASTFLFLCYLSLENVLELGSA